MPFDIKGSALASIAAGVLLVAAVILTEVVHDDFFYLVGLVFLLLLVGLPGLRAYQGGRDGGLGRAGSVLAFVASGALFLLFLVVAVADAFFGLDPDDSDAVGVVLIVGFLAFLVGVVVFGIATARAAVLPPAAAWLLALALPAGILLDLLSSALGAQEGIGFWIGVPAFGVALAWLGYAVWTHPERAPARAY